ncbi:hypothetical protein QBC34DRAFT_499135 [Podospora aff. communis PSN243]|uniref:PLL-like beta propeller domain-containing protein n=1 Tax=Podospora aff. communis PSN243 TaxID=3040156 RepID=A0AAV9G595_9PEZI|nr:hypothetical protein QBC34DRAFT_499135 [Podospora aff. communis PSN243]
MAQPRIGGAAPNATQNGQYSTLPEVIPGFGNLDMTLPEVRQQEQEKMFVGGGYGMVKPVSPSPSPAPGTAEIGDNTNMGGAGASADEPRPNWFRRQRKWVLFAIAGVIVAIVVAVVVGVVVGTKNSEGGTSGSGGSAASNNKDSGSGTNSGSDSATPTGATPFGVPTTFPDAPNGQLLLSTCKGTICPQMLASAQYGSPRTTYIFARGLDNAFWYRTFTAGAWTSEWKSLGGTFISQPTAVSMRDGRVDVFGVYQDKTARYKTFQNGVWETEWTSMNGVCQSQLSVCSRGPDNLEIVHLDASNGVWRKYMADGMTWLPPKWEGIGGYASSTVDVGCAPPSNGVLGRADMVAYGRGNPNYGMTYKRTNATGTGWSGWANATGSFDGDPTVLSSVDRADYFGVATDGTVRHRSWLNATDSMSEEVNLGGGLMSAVAVFATGDSRIDILAVGGDARVWHKARIGQTWGTAWESLGGWFNSAPKVVATGEGEAVVFGLGPNGTIIHANIDVGENFNWGQRQWYSDGGEMTARWYRLGPA